MNLKERASKLKTDIPAVFLALKNKKTPLIAKIVASIVIIYALSPIDLIPDFIPILGMLDDIIILSLLVTLTIKLIPPSVFSECRNNAKGMWENGKPKRWFYALPFVLFWVLIIFIIFKVFFRNSI